MHELIYPQQTGFQPLSVFNGNIITQKFWTLTDARFMERALNLAKYGASRGEVPVGAVLVTRQEQDYPNDRPNNQDKFVYEVIGEGYNQPITTHDPTAHAEIVALRQACQHLQNYRLPRHTTLYVTLEPCTMCIGALIHARLHRLVFATFEPRSGVVGSQLNLTEADFYNHRMYVQHGLYMSQSGQLLKSFFKTRRKK